MSKIVGQIELEKDYEKFLCDHFEMLKCSPVVKKLENCTIVSMGKEDSVFKVATILDIVENHIFKKADEETKGAMILTCKYWAQRLLLYKNNYSKLIEEYSESLYDKVAYVDGVKWMTIVRDEVDLFSFPINSPSYYFYYEILNPAEGDFQDYVEDLLAMGDDPDQVMMDID